MSQISMNTPGEGQGVLQSLASGMQGEAAAPSLSNPFLPSSIIWDSALGWGSPGCRKDTDVWTVVVVVQLLEEDGQSCGTCYPLPLVWGSFGLKTLCSSLPPP